MIQPDWIIVKIDSKRKIKTNNGQYSKEFHLGFKHKFMAAIALALFIGGCSSMNMEKLNSSGPEFNFIEYFEGHSRASGWFSDRFGNVKRHFCGDFYGERQGDVFNLDEKLFYSDGIVEKRVWSVTIDSTGNFSAESDSLVGSASGVQKGSALSMHYVMKVLVAENKIWKLGMSDYMFYQPDKSLHNITEVKKWGLHIGTVSTQYYKHDGSATCLSFKQASTQAKFEWAALSSVG